jgi:Ca2+-transporting ATPase
MAVLYIPALQAVFKTAPLSAAELLLCLSISSVVFVAVEVEKWLRRRGWIYKENVAVFRGKT